MDTTDILPEFEAILDYLQQIVHDSKLAAVFKILFTSPVHYSVDIERQPVFEDHTDCVLTLSSEGARSANLEEYGMEAHLWQVSSAV